MFSAAMKSTTTWNNAKSLSTPDPFGNIDGRVSLFFKCVRGINDVSLYRYMEKSALEDIVDTFIISFYTRDCRGGKGERELGRKMLKWLYNKYPLYFENVIDFIPEYGRWDDIFIFFPNAVEDIDEDQQNIQNNIIKLLSSQLESDLLSMNEGNPVSIAAKWAPTEGDSDDKKYNLVNSICKHMKITKKIYRTKYITPLRKYLKIVETLMCGDKWEEIDFNKVPSYAMKRLKKAFEKHVPTNFHMWKNSLATGETVVKAKQLYPHDIIKEIRTNKYDIVTEEQWKVLEKEVKKYGKFNKTVCVVDTSSSMENPNYLPLDMACALGLLISNTVEGEFHNIVITFEERPTFFKISDGNICKRYNEIRNITWGGSTNLQSVFDMILEKSEKANLSEKDSPDTIIIISDMQFNDIGGKYNYTNFEEIERKYAIYERKRPNLIFWNVNGLPTDFPVTVNDDRTVMLSGASPTVLKSVFSSTKFDTTSILRETLDSERYKKIREVFN